MKKKYLVLECQQKIQSIKLKHICYLHYQDGSITIHLRDNSKILHCESLKNIEQQLSDRFVRINRNIIINLKYSTAYFKASGKVSLTSGVQFSITRRNLPEFLKQLKPAL